MHSLLVRLGRLFRRRPVTPTPAIRILLRVPRARRPGCLPAEILPLYLVGAPALFVVHGTRRDVIHAWIDELEQHNDRIFARAREVN